MSTRAIVAFATIAATGCGTALPDPCAPPRSFAPWDARVVARAEPAPSAGLGAAMIRVYQRRLRRPELPGAGCPFTPTCSEFAIEAIDAYGPLGVLLAIDRILIREHAGLHEHYFVDCVGRRERFRDPVP